MFRCDASPSIGAGHVIRCLALAEAFVAAGTRTIFAVRTETRAVAPALAVAGVDIADLKGPVAVEAAEMAELAGGHCDFLVIDHYGRNRAFETECRKWVSSIIVLDDQTGRSHDCDILLDSGAPESGVYAKFVPQAARVLAGPDFALLRQVIVSRREEALRRRDGRPAKDLLISFGATDPTNVTGMLLDALDAVAMNLDVTIAISAQAPHLEAIRSKIKARVRLVVDADMPALIAQSDFAVGAAGSSAFERACLGLPSIMLVVADNQSGIATMMAKSGAAIVAKPAEIKTGLLTTIETLRDDTDLRVGMARKAAQLVDGLGGRRVAEAVMVLAA